MDKRLGEIIDFGTRRQRVAARAEERAIAKMAAEIRMAECFNDLDRALHPGHALLNGKSDLAGLLRMNQRIAKAHGAGGLAKTCAAVTDMADAVLKMHAKPVPAITKPRGR